MSSKSSNPSSSWASRKAAREASRSALRPSSPALALALVALVFCALVLVPRLASAERLEGASAEENGVAEAGAGRGSSESVEDQSVEDQSDDDRPAYYLREGSLARNRIVALGRDMVIDGEARSHAVVIAGTAYLSGRVAGDVIVLGGEALLAESASVGGDVYVLGGHIDMAPGASIGGKSVAYPEASDLWVSLIGGPSLGLPATSRVVLGAKLALLAFWSFVLLLVLSVARRELVTTSASIQTEPFRNFFLGLTGVAAMVLTALFFSAFSGALLGVPLLVLVAVVALMLRFWGMVAVFHALGSWAHRLLGRRVPVPLIAASWGLALLGLAKLVPYLGIWAWSLATFIGVGAALGTKLGRREPWFEGGST